MPVLDAYGCMSRCRNPGSRALSVDLVHASLANWARVISPDQSFAAHPWTMIKGTLSPISAGSRGALAEGYCTVVVAITGQVPARNPVDEQVLGLLPVPQDLRRVGALFADP